MDLPPVHWDVDAKSLKRQGWMGRARLPASVRKQAGEDIVPAYPWEDPADGCPGGWYRSLFVYSVETYLRGRTEHGGRNSNPLLDRCDDDLVVQLVLYLEREQERWEAWRSEQSDG